ncbi:cytochrome P450 [Spirosoma taeanense]|uniref:Cytochrome P450 n=1 Tax=Spirosoma taeanense TaxID=2735870 RepID=A0A6M5YCT1_9BACT|nr:cytochrome P450 [Spirosoma taeanense]QJW91073.1 cytochrome P450 [Spirosoma taeanense]
METALSSTRAIPVHPGLPVVGNTLSYLRDPLAFLRGLQQQYGSERMVRISVGGRLTTLMLKPEETKQVLQENNRNYGRGKSFAILREFLGNGLLTSDGDFWRRQRRLAQPAFHRQKLILLAETMISEAVAWAERLETMDRQKPVNISAATTDVTLRIVTKTLFGSDLGSRSSDLGRALSHLNHVANNAVINPFRLPKWVPTPDNRAFEKARREVDQLIFSIIETRQRTGESHDDLLDMLLRATDDETGEGMSDAQLRDEMVTLFTAGQETTATSMAWTLYLLAQHPDVLARVKAEISTTLGPRDRPSADDLRAMPFLSQVINESLRLYPPAWVMSRLSLGPDRFGEYMIDANQGVLLSPYVLHHDPATWPKPDQFNPDRFAPELMKDKSDRERHPYSFIPFGGGPRLCIGNQFALMEMQALLTVLLHRFDLQSVPGLHIKPQPLITLRPKQAVRVFLR